MRSRMPKVAHRVAGRAMVEHVLRTAADAVSPSPDPLPSAEPGSPDPAEPHSPGAHYVLVLGHEAEQVRQALGWTPSSGDAFEIVVQERQLGTGDAVRVTREALTGKDSRPETILVLYGDTPLLRPDTLAALIAEHRESDATLTFLTGIAEDPAEYGRVLRDEAGRVLGIVEQRHASPEQLAIREVNSGIYCFAADWLWPRLDRLEPHTNGEYYLTDLVEMAAREGRATRTATAALAETAGVNDRVQLAEAEAILRQRILTDLMYAGVTIEDPASTYVDAGVRVGQDTLIRPGTALRGATVIGAGCEIGPNSMIRDSRIGDNCQVLASWVEESVMDSGSRIGPMSHMRVGGHLSTGANMGNFAEIKNTTLGPDVQMHHFSYAGDATIGAGTNVAAGVITMNYDGQRKHHTEVGEHVFLGCDTLLRAPVTIGDGATTGAGAVVTKDVPPWSVAVGMPARVIKRKPVPEATGTVHDKEISPTSTEATASGPAPATQPGASATTRGASGSGMGTESSEARQGGSQSAAGPLERE